MVLGDFWGHDPLRTTELEGIPRHVWWVFLERVNWGGRPHPKCGWQHPTAGVSDCIKRGKEKPVEPHNSLPSISWLRIQCDQLSCLSLQWTVSFTPWAQINLCSLTCFYNRLIDLSNKKSHGSIVRYFFPHFKKRHESPRVPTCPLLIFVLPISCGRSVTWTQVNSFCCYLPQTPTEMVQVFPSLACTAGFGGWLLLIDRLWLAIQSLFCAFFITNSMTF